MKNAFEGGKNVKISQERFQSDEFWEEVSAKCISCGACTYLCPTCYCFNITDEQGIDKGERIGAGTACMFQHFTLEASGHNPRSKKSQRLKNGSATSLPITRRMYGELPAPAVDGASDIARSPWISARSWRCWPAPEEESGKRSKFMSGQRTNPYLPDLATVNEVIEETPNIKTFRVTFNDAEKMKNFTFEPGQVGQLSVFGVGESTFVINSPPTRMEYLQFSVMKAGEVTAALHDLYVGDQIGVRAPSRQLVSLREMKGKKHPLRRRRHRPRAPPDAYPLHARQPGRLQRYHDHLRGTHHADLCYKTT